MRTGLDVWEAELAASPNVVLKRVTLPNERTSHFICYLVNMFVLFPSLDFWQIDYCGRRIAYKVVMLQYGHSGRGKMM